MSLRTVDVFFLPNTLNLTLIFDPPLLHVIPSLCFSHWKPCLVVGSITRQASGAVVDVQLYYLKAI